MNRLLFLFVAIVVISLKFDVGAGVQHQRRVRNNLGKPISQQSQVMNEGVFGGGAGGKAKRQDSPPGSSKVSNITTTTAQPVANKNGTATTTSPPGSTLMNSSNEIPMNVTTTTTTTTMSSDETTEATTIIITTTTDVPIIVPPTSTPDLNSCACDQIVSVCDMNCCCDQDCSPAEKNLFTDCENSLIYDPVKNKNSPESCVKSYIMYKQNTPFQVDRNDPSLFCVVHENVRKVKEFSITDMEKIKSRILHGKIKTKPKYNWDTASKAFSPATIEPKAYKYGSPIWVIRDSDDGLNYNEEMLTFPVRFNTELCTLNQPVLYLKESLSSCVVQLNQLEKNCDALPLLNANFYIKNFSIISSPNKTAENLTDYMVQNIMPGIACKSNLSTCQDVQAAMGDASMYDVTEVDFPYPFVENGVCRNVMTQLNLTMVHGGIDGIRHIVAKTLLDDIPLSDTSVTQTFGISFVWDNENLDKTNTSSASPTNNNNTDTTVEDLLNMKGLPRSGNPGYLTGKPIILGVKVTEKLPNETSKAVQRIKVLHSNPSLTIQFHGDCPVDSTTISQRQPIQFGYEHIATCRLQLRNFTQCNELQHHVISIILGMDPTSFINSQFHVASYGSPDAFPADWIALNFIDFGKLTGSLFSQSVEQGCDSLVTSVHITVAWAYTGPVDFPQAKITGLFFEPEEPIKISSDQQDITEIAVTTTVSFVDLTGRPSTRVATWPVLSITLPEDTFYPFSGSASAPSSGVSVQKTATTTVTLLTIPFFMIVLRFFNYRRN